MSCKCGPALIALRSSLNRAFPGRSIRSDGCCASSAHSRQNPSSDHEPDASGYAAAYDITHDPASGVDCGRLAPRLQRDPRVRYLIWNRRIWSRERASEGWRPYGGSNPHTSHLHVSVFRFMVRDDAPWQVLDLPAPKPYRKRPTVFLVQHPNGVVELCALVAGNKVSHVGIEDPQDRDAFIAAGVPLVHVSDATWSKWAA